MRYIAGRSLGEIIKTKPLPNLPAANLMEQVARAVQAIHEVGGIHRDLKPENILVDAQGRPYVTDFGLAKWTESAESLTETGQMLGSAPYMSPEQAENAATVKKTTDVYGLGATLYALLTGRPPFQADTPAETLYQVKYVDPVSPRRINPKVDLDLDTIILKCLEKEPERRIKSADELADALQLYLDGKPIPYRPLGPAGRAWRWCRRKPVLAGVSAVAAVLLVVLGITAILLHSKAEEVKTIAQSNDALDTQIHVMSQDLDPGNKGGKLGQEIQKGAQLGQIAEGAQQTAAREQAHREAMTYLDDMGKAAQLIDKGEFDQARQILRQYVPAQAKTDRRAWEWYFLVARCRDAGFTLHGDQKPVLAAADQSGLSVRGHGGQVQAVAWSPDGSRLASADGQGIIRGWNTGDNKIIFEFKATAGVSALAWSPDGKRLAAACQGTAQMGGLAIPFPAQPTIPSPPNVKGRPNQGPRQPGMQPGQQMPGRRGGVDGKNPPVASKASVQIWDLASGKLLKTLKQVANINPLSSMPLPPNATLEDSAASTSRHMFVGSWAASLIWSPPDERLALADDDGKIQIWDLRTNKNDPLRLVAHKGGVHSAAWNPKGDRLASVSGDGIIKIWDPTSDKPIFIAKPIRAAENFVPSISFALAWTEDGKCVNVVSSEGEVRNLDVSSGTASAPHKLVPQAPFAQLGVGRVGAGGERFVWSPNGKLLASIQTGGTVKIWDAATGKENRSIVMPGSQGMVLTAAMCSPAWDPSGRRLALGAPDGTVIAHPVAGQVVKRLAVRRLQIPNALTWSADSTHVLGTEVWSLANDPKVQAAQAQMGDALKAIQDAARAGVIHPPNPKAIMQPPGLVGGPGAAGQKPQAQIQVCDAITGEVVRTLGNHVRPDVLAASPDGNWLASATRAGLVQVWSTKGGDPIPVEEPPPGGAPAGPLQNNGVVVAWSPDSNRLAFSTPKQTSIRVWNLVTRKPIMPPLEGPGKPLRCLAWSRDGKRLAAAAEDGNAKVWDLGRREVVLDFDYFVRQENRGVAKPPAHTMLSWCPDSNLLAVMEEDETTTVWDVSAKRKAAQSLEGHPSPFDIHNIVCAVAWSPSGDRLACASPDGTFILWDTTIWKQVLTLHPPSEGPFAPPTGLPNHVGTLAWSPDGQKLALFAFGRVTIWDATGEEEELTPKWSDQPRNDDAKDDNRSIQGTWLATRSEQGGNVDNDAVLNALAMKLVIQDDKYSRTIVNLTGMGTLKIDPSTKPNSMDMIGVEGADKGMTFLAIYELRGDVLRICFDYNGGKTRPSEFKTTGTDLQLITYKREKHPGPEKAK
jgi:uncharacterized protein (TIGR03067 family)